MPDVLFDTSFFIDLHRGDEGAQRVWDAVLTGRLTGSFSPITVFELWRRQMPRAEELFYRSLFPKLEEARLGRPDAEQAALWIRSMDGRVSEATSRDALIAATASSRGETVYTRNVADYRRFVQGVTTY